MNAVETERHVALVLSGELDAYPRNNQQKSSKMKISIDTQKVQKGTNMQKLQQILKLGGIAVALAVTPAVSQAQITSIHDLDAYAQIDERGNGVIIGLGPLFGLADPYPMQGLPAVEIMSGLTTLRYLPPGGVITGGDLELLDADGHVSDLIRFVNVSTTTRVFFFSSSPGDGSPTDVGIPTDRQSLVVTLPEGPVENGVQGLLYVPQPGQPGYNTATAGVGATWGWNIISEVPEPATVAFLGLGGLLVLLSKRQ